MFLVFIIVHAWTIIYILYFLHAELNCMHAPPPIYESALIWKLHACIYAVGLVSDETWKSLVLESDTSVLVEFWAPWCGPCRMIHPVIDELAKEYAGKLNCYKVNTDASPTIATNYGIRSIPTVMIFNNGEKKDAIIGAVPKSTFCTCIHKFC